MNEREFKYLFLPILSSIIILIFVSIFDWAPQIITIVGSIFSAFVAIYIAETNRFNDRETKNRNKIMLIKYSLSLVPKISQEMTKEIDNYHIYSADIKNKGMENIELRSVSFYYLKEFDKIDKNELFNAISSISKNRLIGVTDKYLMLLSYINNALYVKETVIEQVKRFIASQNEQSLILKNSLEKISKFFLNVKDNPPVDLIVFCKIINKYNWGVNTGKININSFDDFKNHFLYPLAVYNTSGWMQLVKHWKKIEIAINKMEELKQYESNYFELISNDLDLLNNKIIDCEKELGKLVNDLD